MSTKVDELIHAWKMSIRRRAIKNTKIALILLTLTMLVSLINVELYGANVHVGFIQCCIDKLGLKLGLLVYISTILFLVGIGFALGTIPQIGACSVMIVDLIGNLYLLFTGTPLYIFNDAKYWFAETATFLILLFIL